jgi:FtsP/CotA-like multicopper oxidase with cupredoxin domain
MRNSIKTILLAVGAGIFLAGCSQTTMDHSKMNHSQMMNQEKTETKPAAVKIAKDGKVLINIEAREEHWMYNEQLMDTAWTYNGTLPGEEIRVQEGDSVVIQFKNSLPEPSAIHLHGVPVPNEMDGVPGVTQNAVLPGETFNYEFVATTPGTYWYHSHQDGAYQVDKGLYGAFIIEPKQTNDYALDQVIMIDEWSSMGMGNMNGMDHSQMGQNESSNNDSAASHNESMNNAYDTMVINGKATSAIQQIKVKEGQTIKLRLINAGLFTQVVNIPQPFKVTHYDGQEVNEPQELSNVSLRIAPAERYDIRLTMKQPGNWPVSIFAENNKEKLNAVIPLTYEGYEDKLMETAIVFKGFFDFTNYGKNEESSYGTATKEFDMVLGTNDNGETFTINNKKMPDHELYNVKEGDIVKVTITNTTKVDHPMHLHGHFFEVISKDGKPVTGSTIMKDTLNIRPNETYEVVFKADNSGNWMFHCHELHHASGGMVSELRYEGFIPKFTPDPTVNNKPE